MERRYERLQRKSNRLKYNRTRALFYLLCVFVIFMAGNYIVHRSWFSFGRIEVEGSKLVTVDDVKNMTNITEPINLFTIDRGNIVEILSHDLRVEKVDTSYAWPNILKILITDRRPAGYFACAYGGFAKVDFNGQVLSVSKGIKDASAPFISGYVLGNVYDGDTVDDPRVLKLLNFLSKLDKSILEDMSEIVLDSNNHVVIKLLNGLPIILGDIEEIDIKSETFVIICNEIKTKKINAEYIDLTYAKPYIKLRE